MQMLDVAGLSRQWVQVSGWMTSPWQACNGGCCAAHLPRPSQFLVEAHACTYDMCTVMWQRPVATALTVSSDVKHFTDTIDYNSTRFDHKGLLCRVQE